MALWENSFTLSCEDVAEVMMAYLGKPTCLPSAIVVLLSQTRMHYTLA